MTREDKQIVDGFIASTAWNKYISFNLKWRSKVIEL